MSLTSGTGLYADLSAAAAAAHRRDLARTAADSRLAALVRCCRASVRQTLARLVGAAPAPCA